MRNVRVYPFMDAERLRYRAELLDSRGAVQLTGNADTRSAAVSFLLAEAWGFGMSIQPSDYAITQLDVPPEDMAPIPTASSLLRL